MAKYIITWISYTKLSQASKNSNVWKVNTCVNVNPDTLLPRLTQEILTEKMFVCQNPHPSTSFHCQKPLLKYYISIICCVWMMSERFCCQSQSPLYGQTPLSWPCRWPSPPPPQVSLWQMHNKCIESNYFLKWPYIVSWTEHFTSYSFIYLIFIGLPDLQKVVVIPYVVKEGQEVDLSNFSHW